MLSVRLLERVRDVPREAWDALAVPSASPFAEWTWLDCLEEAGCVGADVGWLPRHFALYRGARPRRRRAGVREGEQRRGVRLRLELGRRRRADGDRLLPEARLRDPVHPRDGRPRARRAWRGPRRECVRAFAEARARLLHRGPACRAPTCSSRAKRRPRHGSAQGSSRASASSTTGRTRATGPMDDFLARFNAKKRHQLRREIAQPAKAGSRFETLPPSAHRRASPCARCTSSTARRSTSSTGAGAT